MRQPLAKMDSPFLATQYVSVNRIRTRYSSVGNGEVILFLHGFPENLQTWRHYALLLQGQFRLLACDLKGFGYSDKPAGDYSPWGMADFVKDFMDVLGVEKAHLVGTDIGFNITCAFALRYPARIKKLILMAGALSKDGIIAPEIFLLSISPLGEIILKFFGVLAIKTGLSKGFYNRDLVTKEIFNEYYTPYKESIARKRTLELIRSFNRSGKELLAEAEKIDKPTLILWAQHERFFSLDSAQSLQKKITNSWLEVIPNCGHFIQEEKPAESAQRIISFIQEH